MWHLLDENAHLVHATVTGGIGRESGERRIPHFFASREILDGEVIAETSWPWPWPWSWSWSWSK